MDKVLVLGHTGKLGRALVRAFEGTWEVHGASRSNGNDVADLEQLNVLLRRLEPRTVLNAVALNGLDPCERDPASAIQINALLPRFLAECSREQDFRLVHFSTDAVFNGLRESGPYLESDLPSPTNLYGLSKLGGEAFVAAEAENYLLFRLSILAGPPGANLQFLERVIASARAGEPLRVADDVVCSPSNVKDIAEAVQHSVVGDWPPGLYHLANAGAASLFELVREILSVLGLGTSLEPVSQSRFPALARKTLRTPLASEKVPPLRDWRNAIRECYKHLNPHERLQL